MYDIKAGTAPDDERAEALASALLSMVVVDDRRKAEQLFRASDKRANLLSPETLRFIATAEHVAGLLGADPQLEWSPAVIGLCKAVEAEVVRRILRPLSTRTSRELSSADKGDKDIGRIAMFCADSTRKPSELGTFAHFLQTVIHSQQRRLSSLLITSFLGLAAEWTGSHWLLDPQGLHHALGELTTNFRNRAAHIDELGKEDYESCRDFVVGGKAFFGIWSSQRSDTKNNSVLSVMINEPVNLREWKPQTAELAHARLFTAGRPGRGTPGYGRVRRPVDEAIIDAWVAGLPAVDVLHIVSLLGRKTDGFSEYSYYPFRSCLEAASKPSFQDWLDQRYGPRFLVHEFPTIDAQGIDGDVLERVTTCIRRLLYEGHTVLIIDSAGAERTARICEYLGFHRK